VPPSTLLRATSVQIDDHIGFLTPRRSSHTSSPASTAPLSSAHCRRPPRRRHLRIVTELCPRCRRQAACCQRALRHR
jgi:hypothetical protein